MWTSPCLLRASRVASFAVGVGGTGWTLQGEVFPTAVRGQAAAFCAMIDWLANFVIIEAFPVTQNAISLGGVMVVFSGLCALAIVFDEAANDASACCGELPGPNTPLPGIQGPGGGRTGAVVLSPAIPPGSTTTRAYTHYSLLAAIEDAFALSRLGYAAGAAGLPTG